MSDLLFRNSSDLLIYVNNVRRKATLLEAIWTHVTLTVHESVCCTTGWAPHQPNSSIRLSTLTLFLQWPMWKIHLQTAVQIIGRQQVVLNPLSIVHKCLWISSSICEINMNTMFFWFTFMICFTFSICRKSSGPPTSTAKKRLLVHWPFLSDVLVRMWILQMEFNCLFYLCIFFLKVHQQMWKEFRIMWQKLSNGYCECDEDFYFTKLNYYSVL